MCSIFFARVTYTNCSAHNTKICRRRRNKTKRISETTTEVNEYVICAKPVYSGGRAAKTFHFFEAIVRSKCIYSIEFVDKLLIVRSNTLSNSVISIVILEL